VDRPVTGLMMGVPGIVFIVLGVLIALWPPLLPSLVATASILAGSAILQEDGITAGSLDHGQLNQQNLPKRSKPQAVPRDCRNMQSG
jgi:hypothetical protein